ncbi:hypothetical protein OH77DRAFT_1542797 [Trametes cingulata]|nr:hypothetical protein OH77DRAFT_1542797 [Trametes cingulata]
MDRQGRGPPQRHSSLPASLHRLLVSGPPQPPQGAHGDDPTAPALAPPTGVEGGGGRISPGDTHSSASAAPNADQQLPSLVLTQAAFEGIPRVDPAGAGSRHQSRSPALSTVSQEAGLGAAAVPPALPTLPLPPPPPPPPTAAAAGPSSRRMSESGRGSPASSSTATAVDNYPVAVGSTAYSVTTLSPLRAMILPPVLEPVSAPEGPTGESVPPGEAASVAGPSTGGTAVGEQTRTTGGSEAEVKRSESDTEEGELAVGRGKRPRQERERGRGQREETVQESSTTSSSSSEQHARAPKSKKTLIACHFCRARKLRCDGQRPSCANCRKRSHPCTYEQQPKRRGPGKTPRGSTSTRRTRHSTAAADAARTAEASGSGGGGGGGGGTSQAGAPLAPEAAGVFNAEAASARRIAAEAALAAATAAPSPRDIATQPFEPQLTGPVPTYPGFAYRPPSASAAGQLPPFHFYSVGRGMSRSVASDSVRSSNTSNVSSAPSVPDTEELVEGPQGAEGGSVADEIMDYAELDDFYRQQHPPEPGPGPGEEGSQ